MRYAVRKLIGLVPILLSVTFLVFLMRVLVPGDPVEIMFMGQDVSREAKDELRGQLGLDKPWPVQYAHFVTGLLQGDLGTSFKTRQPVRTEIAARIGNTFELAVYGMLVAVAIGVWAGVLSAVYRDTWLDLVSTVGAVLGMSIPAFWLGLILIENLAVRWQIFPVYGMGSWKHAVLPTLTLGFIAAAGVARMVRSSMLDVLSQDFIRTARAKGLGERVVVYRHGLRNALGAVTTVIGLQFGGLLAGSFLVEVVFAWNGIGDLAVKAIADRDFPLVQGIVLVVSVTYVFVNLGVDLMYSWLDPRVRL